MQISSENFFEPPKSEVNGLNFREAKGIEMPKIKTTWNSDPPERLHAPLLVGQVEKFE